MCLFKRKQKEQIMLSKINEIVVDSYYQLVLYKKDYKHFGNSIIKFVCEGRKNIKITTDKNEIIFDNKIYPMSLLGDITKVDRDTIIIKFIEIIFNIIKSDDWRLTGQENYMLFEELKEVIPAEYINTLNINDEFHEHCEFCMEKIKEHKQEKCYTTLNNYRWICKECFDDFKEIFKFKLKG